MKCKKFMYVEGSNGAKILEIAKHMTDNGPCVVEPYTMLPHKMTFGFTFVRDAEKFVDAMTRAGFSVRAFGNNGISLNNVDVIF